MTIRGFEGMPETGTERSSRLPDRDWLLELSTLLHTSLDVEQMLTLLSHHLAGVVPHLGIELEDAEGVNARVGRPGAHVVRCEIEISDERVGTLTVHRAEPLTDAETAVLERLIGHLGYPVRNALLYRAAVAAAARDPLTGLNNRASLDLILEREVGLAQRHDIPLSLIMLDVDRFKRINDSYGHLVGDYALQGVAATLRACVRQTDPVFRYGGEEFLILLSNTPAPGAARLAERIRTRVADGPVPCPKVKVNLTVSLGVAGLGDVDDGVRLLERADEGVYRSKAGGRNRVTVIDPLTKSREDAG